MTALLIHITVCAETVSLGAEGALTAANAVNPLKENIIRMQRIAAIHLVLFIKIPPVFTYYYNRNS